MARKSQAIVVLVMCANASEARKLALAAVENRFAACGNILGAKALSIYRWKGEIERAGEVLLILKTTRTRFSALEGLLRQLHSYDVPEILALPVFASSGSYLNWVHENVS